MPTINRIRIFNVSYDNNHIKDCVFDMHGGSNSLFNLKNGGGKSVMVQLLFQPVLPETEIDKRKITDYMPKNFTPLHIIIEWLLDDTKENQYFLTGICMNLSKSEKSENDGQNNKTCRYFTYTNSYSKGNEYDIEHFPLKDDNDRIFSYDAIYNKLKKLNNTDFYVFSENKQTEYKKELEQHCIYKSEWELLKKINQKEGGLTNLFENCKTSDKLFDEWILKTVSDCMPNARKSLIEMISELVQSILKNKDDIREKELLEKLSADTKQFIQYLKEYWDKLDEKEKKELFFCGVRNFENQKLQESENALESARQTQEKCKSEEKHINIERISEDIINYKKEKSANETELVRIETELPKKQSEFKTTEYKYRCMEAAKIYKEMKSSETERNAARNVIETLKKDETSTRLKNIEYTLYMLYSEQAEKYNTEAENHKKEIIALNEKEKSLNAEIENLRKQKEKDISEKTRLDVMQEQFLEVEKRFREIIGRLPQRNILNNLVNEDVEEIQNMLDESLEKAEKHLDECSKEYDETKLKTEHYKEEDTRLQDEHMQQQKELSKAETELEICEKESENIKGILRKYDIDEKYLFEKEYNINIINEKITEISNECKKLNQNLCKKEEILEKLNKKQLHISREFVEILEENGIDYQTGEDYLSMQSSEYLSKLLSENSMLPYCFIVSDSDFEKILSIAPETTIDRICPVIKRSDIGKKIAPPDVRFYNLYNKESIDSQTSKDYDKRLKAEIDNLNNTISQSEELINKYNKDKNDIIDFNYTPGIYSQLKINFETTRKTLKDTEHKINENKTELKQSEDKLLLIDKEIQKAKENVESSEEKVKKFGEYLEAARENISNRYKADELDAKMEQADCTIDEISEELNKIKDLKFQENKAEYDCQNKASRSEENASKLASCKTGDFLDNDIEQLEIEYTELSNKFSIERKHQEKIYTEAARKINDCSKKLSSEFSELSEADYNIVYDSDKCEQLKTEQEKLQKTINSLSSEKEQIISSIKRISDNIKRCETDLRRYGIDEPLSASEIKGNYESRLDECSKKLKEAENDEEKFREEVKIHEERINKLDKIIPEKIENADFVPVISETIDIQQHKEELDGIKKSLAERKQKVKSFCDEIKKKYFGENDIIVKEMLDIFSSDDYYNSKNNYEKDLNGVLQHINDEISILQNSLEKIEDKKQHIIKHTFEHGCKLYDEVMSIFKNSYEKLQEGKSRHKIMEIDISDSLDRQASEKRISDYVNTELAKLRDDVQNDYEDISKLTDRLKKVFSDRNIFNTITNKSTYHIKVYKVTENGHLESWESVYSGAERFVAYFMIFAALMAYSRKRISGENNNIKSVFLSDNPFGATSSERPLNALLKIAQKYKLQLICFTALQQSSITNEFDLIYQLALHKAVYSNNSYLKIDDVKKKDNIQSDSDLEYISMFESKRDQLSLF